MNTIIKMANIPNEQEYQKFFDLGTDHVLTKTNGKKLLMLYTVTL